MNPPEAAEVQPLFHGCVEGDMFGHVLMNLSRHWRRLLDVRLAELGLTDATWVPLFHLYVSGDGISQKALAHRVALDSSTLVRVLDVLETRQLVTRKTDAHDRRSKRLWLTDAGHAAIADVRAKLATVEAVLLQDMPAADVQALQRGMLQLSQRLAQVLNAEHMHPALPADSKEAL